MRSRRFSFLTIPLLLLLLFGFTGVRTTGNSIAGQLQHVSPGPLKLYLEEDLNRKKRKLVVEIQVDSLGRFRYEGILQPYIYSLQLSPERTVMLAIDGNEQIGITGDLAGNEPLLITGSPGTDMLRAYERFRKESLERLVISIREQIKTLRAHGKTENDPEIVALSDLEVMNYDRHKNELIGFIKKEMGTSIAVYATSVRWDGKENMSFLSDLANRFESAHPKTEIAKRVREKVQMMIASNIGAKAADIRLPDKNGEPISLSSVHAKYILIDFWASWCLPCRRESALLGGLYQEYKQKGFEIYGVGLESGKEPWIKAIEHDNRTWINVSSQQQFETAAAFEYAITALPANVLIDSNGTIMGRNLHGNDLKNAIQNLFQQNKN
jgi:thiol-disulfide isomerase/thioredoxin